MRRPITAHIRTAVAALLVAATLSACGGAPDIGHAVSSTSDGACLACHVTGEAGAPITRHPQSANCVTCHRQGGIQDVGAMVPQIIWPSAD